MAQKEEKKLFPAQEESELVLDIIRKHWYTYVIFWFVTFIMSIPIIIGSYLWFSGTITISPTLENIIIILVPIYLLFILGLLIYGFVDYYLDVYIVTDRRIVDISQNGLFKRNISELNLRQIQDVNATVQGFAATLLHFGDLHIQTAAETPNFVFQSIPHPYEISKKILDLHEAYMQHTEREEIEEETGRSTKSSDNISVSESLKKTLTEKWFEEGSDFCYSDESCRHKLLEGVNKHLAEEKTKPKAKSTDKEGELKEGKEVDL